MYSRMTYRSKMVEGMSADDIQAIGDHARQANWKRGITGALIEFEGHFIQILEGEPAEITSLSERIRKDDRHEQFDILQHVAIPEPLFTSWHMSIIREPSADLKHCLRQLNDAFDDKSRTIELRARLCEGLIFIVLGEIKQESKIA